MCDWKFLEKLPDLEVLFLCRERENLDLDSYLSYSSLKEENTNAFVTDYRINFEMVHPYLSTSSNKATIDEIKMDSIYWWHDFERKDFERAEKSEVRLVLVENS